MCFLCVSSSCHVDRVFHKSSKRRVNQGGLIHPNHPDSGFLFIRTVSFFDCDFGIFIRHDKLIYNLILSFNHYAEYLLSWRLKYDKKCKEHHPG